MHWFANYHNILILFFYILHKIKDLWCLFKLKLDDIKLSTYFSHIFDFEIILFLCNFKVLPAHLLYILKHQQVAKRLFLYLCLPLLKSRRTSCCVLLRTYDLVRMLFVGRFRDLICFREEPKLPSPHIVRPTEYSDQDIRKNNYSICHTQK